MLSEVTKHQLPWVTTVFPLHTEHREFQTKLSQFTPYQDTDNCKCRYLAYKREKDKLKLYASVCFDPYFLFFCPGRKLSIPSNSINLSGKSLRQIRGSQWTLLNTKNPHILSVNLESRGLSHYFGSSIPLSVCLKYSSGRTLPPGKNLILLTPASPFYSCRWRHYKA